MFIVKKQISRRTFLRGTGVTLALPLLDAMVPAATMLAQTAATPKPRFVAAFVPHGMSPGYWVPDNVGSGFTMPPIFEPLERYRKQTVILSVRSPASRNARAREAVVLQPEDPVVLGQRAKPLRPALCWYCGRNSNRCV